MLASNETIEWFVQFPTQHCFMSHMFLLNVSDFLIDEYSSIKWSKDGKRCTNLNLVLLLSGNNPNHYQVRQFSDK